MQTNYLYSAASHARLVEAEIKSRETLITES